VEILAGLPRDQAKLDLSIIIVNWNSSGYLEKCLKSIVDNTSGPSFEVIVVDNASYDGCDRVANQYSGVATLIQSESNLGFSKANNLGYRHSTGDVLLFLNPDTEIPFDALQKMYRTSISLCDAGGLGCKVLNSDGTIQTSCIQAFPTITNQLLDAEFLRNLFPKLRFWGMRPLFETSDSPVEVEVVAGSCLMVHRAAFEKAGFFSEEYFMYGEDLDLCYKLRGCGYRNYYTGGASIVHHGGGSTKSTGKRSFSSVLMRDSVEKFLRKSKGNLYSRIFVFSLQLASLARIILLLILYPAALLKLLDKMALEKGLAKWKNIFLWSIGRGGWVRNY
jgi:hypothetical protein